MYKMFIAVLVALAMSPTAQAQQLISIAQDQYPAGVLPYMNAIVVVAFTITADGRAEGVTLSKSSGFPPFDENAVAVMATAKFAPAIDKDGKSVAVPAVMPIRYGGELLTMDRQCRGLNNEMKEFVRFNPHLRPDDTQNAVDIKNFLVDGRFSRWGSPGSTVENRTQRLSFIWELIVKQCAHRPLHHIDDVIATLVKQHGY